MADELTIDIGIRAYKPDSKIDTAREGVASFTCDLNSDIVAGNTQSIPTTAAGTAIVLSAGLSAGAVAFFRNLDGTNYLEIGRQVGGTFYEVAKLGPGMPALIPIASTGLYARSNTSACKLYHRAYQ